MLRIRFLVAWLGLVRHRSGVQSSPAPVGPRAKPLKAVIGTVTVTAVVGVLLAMPVSAEPTASELANAEAGINVVCPGNTIDESEGSFALTLVNHTPNDESNGHMIGYWSARNAPGFSRNKLSVYAYGGSEAAPDSATRGVDYIQVSRLLHRTSTSQRVPGRAEGGLETVIVDDDYAEPDGKRFEMRWDNASTKPNASDATCIIKINDDDGVGIHRWTIASEPDHGDTYMVGEDIRFYAHFTKAVTNVNPYTDENADYAAVRVKIGDELRWAEYNREVNSQLHEFVYTVAAGDMDSDGVSIPTANPDCDECEGAFRTGESEYPNSESDPGLWIVDDKNEQRPEDYEVNYRYRGMNADRDHRIDSRTAVIDIRVVSVPPNADTLKPGDARYGYRFGDTVKFAVQFSAPVSSGLDQTSSDEDEEDEEDDADEQEELGRPRLKMQGAWSPGATEATGGIFRYAEYDSGDGTDVWVFAYTVGQFDHSPAGVQISGPTIGHLFDGDMPGDFADLRPDPIRRGFNSLQKHGFNARPRILEMSSETGKFFQGDEPVVEVKFDQAVRVHSSRGRPELSLIANKDGDRSWATAEYSSGSGTDTLEFKVEFSPRSDPDGATLETGVAWEIDDVEFFEGMTDGSSITADPTVGYRWDGFVPETRFEGLELYAKTVLMSGHNIVSDPGDDNAYVAGDVMVAQVDFSHEVTAVGDVQYAFELDQEAELEDRIRWMTLVPGQELTDTESLRFQYTVTEDDRSTDRGVLFNITIGAEPDGDPVLMLGQGAELNSTVGTVYGDRFPDLADNEIHVWRYGIDNGSTGGSGHLVRGMPIRLGDGEDGIRKLRVSEVAANADVGDPLDVYDELGADLSFSIIAGRDGASFAIGSDGQLTAAVDLDGAVKHVYSLYVDVKRVPDGDTVTEAQALTRFIPVTVSIDAPGIVAFDPDPLRATVDRWSGFQSLLSDENDPILNTRWKWEEQDVGRPWVVKHESTTARRPSEYFTNDLIDKEWEGVRYRATATYSNADGDTLTASAITSWIYVPVSFAESSYSFTVSSGAASGTSLNGSDGFGAAADDDEDDELEYVGNATVTYTLGGTDADAFDIDSTTGEITLSDDWDSSTKTSWSIAVTATVTKSSVELTSASTPVAVTAQTGGV